MHWGLPYAIVERMMIDAPKYIPAKTENDKKDTAKPLTPEIAADLHRLYNP